MLVSFETQSTAALIPTTTQTTLTTIQITQESIGQIISNFLESITCSNNLTPRKPPAAYDNVLHSQVNRYSIDMNSEEQVNVDINSNKITLQNQNSDADNHKFTIKQLSSGYSNTTSSSSASFL